MAADGAHVGDAAVTQLGEHAHPLLGTFPAGRANPHAEHVAFTVDSDPHRHLNRPVGDLPVPDLQDDGVDQHKGVGYAAGPSTLPLRRSRGTVIRTSPTSVRTVFPLEPFRELPGP